MNQIYPFVTDPKGNQIQLQFIRNFYNEQNELTYLFRIEDGGHKISIKNVKGTWESLPNYISLPHWPQELGEQIDTFNQNN